MAITVHQSPQEYVPGFNNIWYVLSSTNTAQENFSYLCDVYLVDGDNNNIKFAGANYLRLKVPAHPVKTSGVVDIGRVVANYLTSDLNNDAYSFQSSPKSIVRATAKFGEEYGPSSGITAYPDLTIAADIYVWNSIFDFLDFKDFAKTDFVVASTGFGTKRMLTDRHASGVVRSDQNAWLYGLVSVVNGVANAFINTYNSSGALIGSYRVANPNNSMTLIKNRMVRFPAGGYNIARISNPVTIVGTTPIITSSVKTYEIYFADSAALRVTESQFYKISDDCTHHAIVILHFKNKLGGFDTFQFIKGSQFKSSIKRKDFEKTLGDYIGGGRFGFDKNRRLKTTIHTEIEDRLSLNSDWITESESTWLEQLFTSSETYEDQGNNNLVAVNIKETTYTRRKHVTDKIFNIEITIEYSYPRFTQLA